MKTMKERIPAKENWIYVVGETSGYPRCVYFGLYDEKSRRQINLYCSFTFGDFLNKVGYEDGTSLEDITTEYAEEIFLSPNDATFLRQVMKKDYSDEHRARVLRVLKKGYRNLKNDPSPERTRKVRLRDLF